jgi:hypothetical protein
MIIKAIVYALALIVGGGFRSYEWMRRKLLPRKVLQRQDEEGIQRIFDEAERVRNSPLSRTIDPVWQSYRKAALIAEEIAVLTGHESKSSTNRPR